MTKQINTVIIYYVEKFEDIKMIQENKWIDIEQTKKLDDVCIHLNHQPPTHMYIPSGQTYEHECPGCGDKTILRSPSIIW